MPTILKKLKIILLTLLLFKTGFSQTMVPDSAAGFTGKAYYEYVSAIKEDLELFNGKEHVEYQFSFEYGSPYFFESSFSKGDVTYQNKTYKDIPLMYDIIKDEIAILNYKLYRLIPDKTKVDAFTVHGHHFIKLANSISNYKELPKGYFDLLYNGEISMLAKRTKNIQNRYKNTSIETRVYSKDFFYIQKNNTLLEFRSKKSFLKLLSDKKKEIAQFTRQNNLSYRAGKEQTMVKIISYYNSILK